MAAVLENCRGDHASASRFIAGHGIWQCYRGDPVPGAGMYLQIGKANPDFVQIGVSSGSLAGHAGCYWNSRTVTAHTEIRSANQIHQHVLGGMQELAADVPGRCPGCSMPRLWFNMITTELGLDPKLRETYLRLRRQYVGF